MATTELAKLSKTDLVKQASSMKRRAQQFKKNAETTAEKLIFAGAGGLGAFGAGFLMGGKERDYQQLVTEKGQEEADKADPRLIGGLVPWPKPEPLQSLAPVPNSKRYVRSTAEPPPLLDHPNPLRRVPSGRRSVTTVPCSPRMLRI